MGFERAAEELVDGLPARVLGVACNKIREAPRAASRQLQDDAAVVRAVHVLDVRREELEIEFVGEAGERATGQLVEPHGESSQRISGVATTGDLAVDHGENAFGLS